VFDMRSGHLLTRRQELRNYFKELEDELCEAKRWPLVAAPEDEPG
jgi:hypothetical protein